MFPKHWSRTMSNILKLSEVQTCEVCDNHPDHKIQCFECGGTGYSKQYAIYEREQLKAWIAQIKKRKANYTQDALSSLI